MKNLEHNENEDLQNPERRGYEKLEVLSTQEGGTTHTE